MTSAVDERRASTGLGRRSRRDDSHNVESRARRRYGVIGIVVAIVAWQLVTSYWLTTGAQLAPPWDVAVEMARQVTTAELWESSLMTLRAWAIGLALSIAVGVPIGILIGTSAVLWHALRPTLDFLRSVPGVALMPLTLVLWGPTLQSDVFLIIFGTIWTLIVQSTYSVRAVDETALETGRSFGFTRAETIRWIVLPSALPYLATGLRIASIVALTVAISAELLIGNPGLGNMIGLARSYGQYTTMYSLILVSGVIGIVMQAGSTALERRALRWHESQRSGEGQAGR